MSVQLNHTIVPARDPAASAAFLADILGCAAPVRHDPFYAVKLDNGVTMDFMRAEEPIPWHHYAFMVSESEFDSIFARMHERGLQYWADPGHHRPDEINRNDGCRRVYWEDSNGHNLEIITRPYGGG